MLLRTFILTSAVAFAAAPALRLPENPRPLNYAAELTLSPDKLTFEARIDIEVNFSASTDLFYINGKELTITNASINDAKLNVKQANEDFIELRPSSKIPAGTAKLHFDYSGKISPKSSEGIFQGRDGDANYLFTQFEEIDARRAFPCFDQPGFKTPWQITLHVPSGDRAFANTPQVSETEESGGMKKVVFAPTKPLPSYLVAFAVGPFDVVDAGRVGANGAAVRIITPKNKADHAKYAAEITAKLVEMEEQYFGIPYPFEKLDCIAIPLTYGFGAMENAGLITFSETILLANPATDTERRHRNYASVAAHEIAHQWSGDLVTLAWWDDTWLNEAFATWMSSKILAEWKPEWKTRLDDLGSKFGAMSEDSLVTTRKIRQEILSNDDISNAFDDITYEKGAAVIRMFEVWAGEKQFQSGVTAYLKRYSYKSARSSDFLDAISQTGQPHLSAAFQTFLNQPGVPEVSVTLKCDGAPSVELSQKHYLPVGSSGSSKETWQVPICVRYRNGASVEQECFLLDKANSTFKLTKSSACPSLIAANENASGYYISSYQGGLLNKIVDSSDFLNSAEQLTLIHDVSTLAGSGDLKISRALDVAARFANSPEREIVMQARSIVAGVRRFVANAEMENYAQFVLKTFGAGARALGWSAKPGEDQDTRLMRPIIVPFVARYDSELTAEARKLADQWLENRTGIDPDMIGSVLSAAAYHGDRALFDALVRELPKTKERRLRNNIIAAIGSFRDPKLLAAALDLIIHSDIDARETSSLLYSGMGNPATERMAFEFVKNNYDEILKRAPSGGGSDFGASLPYSAAGFCDASSEKEYKDFFEERAKKFTGGPRVYQQVLESIHLCEAEKASEAPDIEAYFAKR